MSGMHAYTDEEFREAARKLYEREEEISFHTNGEVDRSTSGAWVQAWVWVHGSDVREVRQSKRAGSFLK